MEIKETQILCGTGTGFVQHTEMLCPAQKWFLRHAAMPCLALARKCSLFGSRHVLSKTDMLDNAVSGNATHPDLTEPQNLRASKPLSLRTSLGGKREA